MAIINGTQNSIYINYLINWENVHILAICRVCNISLQINRQTIHFLGSVHTLMVVVLWPFLISFIDQLYIDLEKVLSYESMSYVHLHTYVGSCFVVFL